MNDQEIKCKALECAVQLLAGFGKDEQERRFSRDVPTQVAIGFSEEFYKYLTQSK